MSVNQSASSELARSVRKYIGKYIELYVSENDIIRGRLRNVKGDRLVFNPHVGYRYPVSSCNNQPWLAFIETDLEQRAIEPLYRIVETSERDMRVQVRCLNRTAKKQAENEAEMRALARQNILRK